MKSRFPALAKILGSGLAKVPGRLPGCRPASIGDPGPGAILTVLMEVSARCAPVHVGPHYICAVDRQNSLLCTIG